MEIPENGQTTSYTYTNAGSFTVTLTVTDDNGGTGTASFAIEAIAPNQSPTASFVTTPTSGKAPLSVSLDATGSTDPDGSIVSYHWDFGNGTTNTGVTTQTTFRLSGNIYNYTYSNG